jgi:hypothetical protein
MIALIPALIGAVSGAIVAGVGWLVTHVLASKREELARRNSAAREHLARQIQELYGPLLGLIQHSRMVFEVAAKVLPTRPDGPLDRSRFSEREHEVYRFFIERYFLPSNAEIRRLIRSKMHLLGGGLLPGSFQEFFIHEAQFETLHRLWKEKGVDFSQITGPGWPPEFERQVQRTLDQLRERHQTFLQRLGAVEHTGDS